MKVGSFLMISLSSNKLLIIAIIFIIIIIIGNKFGYDIFRGFIKGCSSSITINPFLVSHFYFTTRSVGSYVWIITLDTQRLPTYIATAYIATRQNTIIARRQLRRTTSSYHRNKPAHFLNTMKYQIMKLYLQKRKVWYHNSYQLVPRVH